MSGVGGLYTNSAIVKRKVVEPVKEPAFAQYMEIGTLSEQDQTIDNMSTMKQVRTKKRRSTGRKGSVRVKKPKKTHGKQKTRTVKGKSKNKSKGRSVNKDRF